MDQEDGLEGRSEEGIVWEGCAFVMLPQLNLHTLEDRPSHDIKLRDSPRGRGQKRVQLSLGSALLAPRETEKALRLARAGRSRRAGASARTFLTTPP